MRDETKATLTLFVQTARRLSSTRFAKYLESGGKLSVTLRGGICVSEDNAIELRLPDDEDMQAFALTFRMFVQDRDGISIRELAKLADSDNGLSPEWQQRMKGTRAWLKDYLSQPTNVWLRDGSTPNFQSVQETFLYGFVAHLEKKYQPTLTLWESERAKYTILWLEFNAILAQSYYVIKDIALFTQQELDGEKIALA